MNELKDCVFRLFYLRIMHVCVYLFKYLKIKNNKVVFIQNDGDGFGDSLKYIAKELHNQCPLCDIVWLVRDKNCQMPDYIRKVKFPRIESCVELSSAKIVINNQKSDIPVIKKRDQLFVYIPHGQSGAKRTEKDAESRLSKEYIAMSKKHSSLMDIFVSASKYQTNDFYQNYWFSKEVWETGFPRNDLFFINSEDNKRIIKKYYNIPENKRIVYYSPTFRDNNSNTSFCLDMNRLLSALEKKSNQEWCCIVSLHPNFKWYKKPTIERSNSVLVISHCPDVQELLYISDLLITDYSSIMLDFALSKKPVFLFATDIEDYKSMRGLKSMYFRMPFPLCRSNDELENAVNEFDLSSYQKRLTHFYKHDLCSFDDGHATERIVGFIKSYM